MGEDRESETEEVEEVEELEDHNFGLISIEDGSRLKYSVRYIEY